MLPQLAAAAAAVLAAQALLTHAATNTRRFSVHAFAMNVALVYGVTLAVRLADPAFLLGPAALKLVFVAWQGWSGGVQKYITTEYLYNDFFENVTAGSPFSGHYSEGDYAGLVPFSLLDYSDDNVRRVMRWALGSYEAYYADETTGAAHTLFDAGLMSRSQASKYEWIVGKLGITPRSRVLEIGFGKLELMERIRRTGATVEGANISAEQLAAAERRGFTCHRISLNELHEHVDRLAGRYDVVITNGSLEYLVQYNDDVREVASHDGRGKRWWTYLRFARAVHAILRPGGRWFTTTIHVNRIDGRTDAHFFKDYLASGRTRAVDVYNAYALIWGNEGSYPYNPDQLTSNAERAGFATTLQENRTLDYFCYSIHWMILQLSHRRRLSWTAAASSALRHAASWAVAPYYLESYLCYTPVADPRRIPWLWQFIKQPDGYWPVTHKWIVFTKQ